MKYIVPYMEQLDLNQIRIFIKLVEAGSFTKAAQVLKLPKSRVSRKIAALESELGAQLVYRTTRQFQLTDTGRLYYQSAKSHIESLESLAGQVSSSAEEVSGLIKITAPDDVGATLIPPILDEFTRRYPRVKFELLFTQAYVDLVKESVDLGVRIGHLRDSSLKARKVGTMRSVLVASPSFLERHPVESDLQRLAEAPYLGLSQNPKLEIFRTTDNRKISLKTNAVITANNPAVLVRLAQLGKGYTFVPEFLCKELLRDGRLVHIHRNLHGPEIPISLISPHTKETPHKVKRFVEFALEKLKEHYS